MLVQVAQKPREDLALLVKEQVFKRRLLLLVEHLLQDLREVAAEDWQRFIVLVEEAAEHVEEREFLLLDGLFGGSSSCLAKALVIIFLLLDVNLVVLTGCGLFVGILDALLEPDRSQGLLFLIAREGCALVFAIDLKVIVESVDQLLLRGLLSLQKCNKKF